MNPAVKQLLEKANAQAQQNDNSKITQLINKIDRDIAFLNDRLQHIDRLSSDNPVLAQTYQSMLRSREQAKTRLLTEPFVDSSEFKDLLGSDHQTPPLN